ncbi:MAG: DUF1573 domain-containing protein [Ignavibacteriaceae bacterium]|nr:DUF1573 domain-containing protein [Ignavibacteriaceae bacterium]
MKTLLFILVMFTAFTSAQTVSTKAELSAGSHDFGKVKPGVKLKYELFVKNIGQMPVVITGVKTGKKYISAEWEKAPVMLGKTRLITLTISIPANYGGFEMATIEVFYNNANSDPLKFTLAFEASE